MDLETIRLLTKHVEEHESTVALVVSEIAAALAAQSTLDLQAFTAEIRDRADHQPEAAPCLEKLLEDLEKFRRESDGGRRLG